MSSRPTRRTFLQTAAGGALLGASDLGFLSQLNPVSAGEAKVDPKVVQLRPEIEPTVRLIEETPRAELIEKMAAKVKQGTTYKEVLASLLLAGVRNIQPRPSVGFKFHAVLVVNSAHLAAQKAPEAERWLPIFWALDAFKSSQARDVREGDWTMAPVKESSMPSKENAKAAFLEAMHNWDVEAADAAVASLARHSTAKETFELFARLGCRDYRSIGHKAIYVANSFRTLETIGWEHAEPVLRSLAYALLNHNGEPNPSKSDLAADRPYRRNLKLVKTIRKDWLKGKTIGDATLDLVSLFRTLNADEACDYVVEKLNQEISVQAITDAYFLVAGELLMRQPGIVALHAMTTTNALYYAMQTSTNDETRRLLLLQNAAFLTMFRESLKSRGRVGDGDILELSPAKTDNKEDAITEIFTDISRDRNAAAQKLLGYLDAKHPTKPLLHQAQRLIFLKGRDAHDYKFSSAVLEDFSHISPGFRNSFLASSVYNLQGSQRGNNALVSRIQSALE